MPDEGLSVGLVRLDLVVTGYDCPACWGLPCAGIGRPVEERVSVQKLKASLWLAEEYPLTLHDQLLPIVDLLVSCRILQ